MPLFSVDNKFLKNNGLEVIRLTQDNFDDVVPAYIDSLELKYLTCRISKPMLFHKLKYYKIINGYLHLYNLATKYLQLVTIPFNDKGEFIPYSELLSHVKKYHISSIQYAPKSCYWFTDEKISVDLPKRFRFYHNAQEYILDNEATVNMSGHEWYEFRRKIKKFIKRYGEPELIPYSNNLHHEFMSVYDKWKPIFSSVRKNKIWDTSYFPLTIKIFPDTSFLVRLHNEYVGVIAFAPLAKNVFCGMHRKLLRGYSYLPQYLQWIQAKIIWEQYGVKYFQEGDDGDDEGLKEFKLGLNPVHIINTCELITK